MCGIAGVVASEGMRFRGLARELLRVLRHRGPDDSGWLTASPRGVKSGRGDAEDGPAQVLLVHRRLSILDLSEAGWQPMSLPGGRFHIVFNGEIYNYLELRAELSRLGCRFASHSDTEVLLHAYATWGPQCLGRLIGMFAFAVLDTHKRSLFLARDPFGIKPLYYSVLPGGFAFASEIKALRCVPGVGSAADPARVYEYLRLGLTDHGGRTLFRDIRQLPSAHFVEVAIDRPAPAPVRYWQPACRDTLDLSPQEAANRLRELFLDNVRLHLRSDVPVGAALSGGIDSSAIVAAMRYLEPDLELHTFSFIADDARVNEERWVDTAGKTVGAAIHKVRVAPGELAADLDELIRQQDEPFGSSSIYAQCRVFRRARDAGIKVMLDGQGADEVFAGYRWYLAARLASLVRQGRWGKALAFLGGAARQPGSGGAQRLVLQAAGLLFPELKGQAQRFVGNDPMPAWLDARWFTRHGVAARPPRRCPPPHVLREQLWRTLAETSLPMLLRYEDRNSMAHSIESRVPFLTAPLVEFALQLPEEYLLAADGTSKDIFRRALRGLVPDAILDRRDKVGFETGEQRWLAALRPWVEQTLASEAARAVPALRHRRLQDEWHAVLAQRRPFDFQVWRWLNLVRWVEVCRPTFPA